MFYDILIMAICLIISIYALFLLYKLTIIDLKDYILPNKYGQVQSV